MQTLQARSARVHRAHAGAQVFGERTGEQRATEDAPDDDAGELAIRETIVGRRRRRRRRRWRRRRDGVVAPFPDVLAVAIDAADVGAGDAEAVVVLLHEGEHSLLVARRRVDPAVEYGGMSDE